MSRKSREQRRRKRQAKLAQMGAGKGNSRYAQKVAS